MAALGDLTPLQGDDNIALQFIFPSYGIVDFGGDQDFYYIAVPPINPASIYS